MNRAGKKGINKYMAERLGVRGHRLSSGGLLVSIDGLRFHELACVRESVCT